MEPLPDPRWADRREVPTPDYLDRYAEYWVGLLPEHRRIIDLRFTDLGPLRLLRTARSLFFHSWYDLDFLPVAVLVAYQAVEAAFRLLYPEPAKADFYALIKRAKADGRLSGLHAFLVDDLRDMRNLLSHPWDMTHPGLDVTANMLTYAHRVVAAIMQAAGHDW
jgi:hypothetical protein